MKRLFVPGEEWVYYKIYTGVKSSDNILINYILPLSKKLTDLKIIKKWFFIRYADPDEHLRVRFLLSNISNFGVVVSEINLSLKSLIEDDIIWDIKLDSYKRELERYGANCFPIYEDIFYVDSSFILRFLKELLEERYLPYLGIRIIDTFLSEFKLSDKDKIEFLELWFNGLGKEFGYDRNLKIQLDKKFRKMRKEIDLLFDNSMWPENFRNMLDLYTKEIRSGVNELMINSLSKKEKISIINSLCHMAINRLFRSKQRLSEFVIYGLMIKMLKSNLKKKSNLELINK
ncbi:hypothetical protein GCQ56_10490 [Marinifilum sp. N1E240]|uniref:thiopeptide-type bacteriocin biosynthesis protein n=1 Tax=Marinifilum sp. N1E240 TaxID=2608082 RepID=UPI00128B5D36|nr:thiopeptide-type bacteriocin biosynthesis protein [Marinifilum sp. N1E240]MPQ47432.1 hypothetical protein [Marinifilum sp. N1E240]